MNPGITTQTPRTLSSLNLQTSIGGLSPVPLTFIVQGTNQPDVLLGATQSLRWPRYGSQAVLVNRTGRNQNVNVLSQTMTLGASDVDPVDGKLHIRFAFAPVFEDPGHTFIQEPYYFIQVTNVTHNKIVYTAFGNPQVPGIPWKTVATGGTTYAYTDWQLVDVAPGFPALSINDQVELQIIAAGCSVGGHIGQVYVDGVSSRMIPGISVEGTGPAEASAGTNITYNLTYLNGGAAAATGVIFQFTTPPNTTFQSLNPPPGFSCTMPAVGAAGTVICDGGPPLLGDLGSYGVTVNINSGTTDPIVASNYSIQSDQETLLLGPHINTAIAAPPSIGKAFGAASIPVNGTTSLTFIITNPNAIAAFMGLAFSDTMPAGLVVATPNGLTNTCGGTATAAAGSNSISLTGGALAANNAQCTVVANVTGATVGVKHNVSGNVSANVGAGSTAAADINVVLPPFIGKVFGATSIPLYATISLTFAVTNPNADSTLTGLAFSYRLPAGLVVATPGGLTNTCGGTATAGNNSISLSGGVLASGGAPCTVVVNVTGTTAGTKNNVSGNVSSNESGMGGTASASIIVVAPPVISKTFGATLSIPVGQTALLSFTISNPNASIALTGVAFTDSLPGLVVANPNGVTGSCGGGTITATPGSNTISLAGAALDAASACTFGVNVKGTGDGVQNHLTSPVTSIEGGLGNTAEATIIVGDTFQLRYISNLNKGDSFVNLTNTGKNGGFDPEGDICANVYVFTTDQQLIACCSCPLTPNHQKTLSGKNDLVSNALTSGVVNEATVALLVTANPTGSAAACDASAVTASQLTIGLGAYGTTLHARPGGSYGTTETEFSPASLSTSELSKLSRYCEFIQAIGSGFGICGSCQVGAAGASRQ